MADLNSGITGGPQVIVVMAGMNGQIVSAKADFDLEKLLLVPVDQIADAYKNAVVACVRQCAREAEAAGIFRVG